MASAHPGDVSREQLRPTLGNGEEVNTARLSAQESMAIRQLHALHYSENLLCHVLMIAPCMPYSELMCKPRDCMRARRVKLVRACLHDV